MSKRALIAFAILAVSAIASFGVGVVFIIGEFTSHTRISDGETWTAPESTRFTLWVPTRAGNAPVELIDRDATVELSTAQNATEFTINNESFMARGAFDATTGTQYTVRSEAGTVLIRPAGMGGVLYAILAFTLGGILMLIAFVPFTLWLVSLFKKN